MQMKIMKLFLVGAALLLCFPLFAEVKPCEELKTEIEAKLKDKGVANYTLEVVPADQIKDQKVVGSCDGGKSKITYAKAAAGEKKTEAK
jgi:hypothetical protein